MKRFTVVLFVLLLGAGIVVPALAAPRVVRRAPIRRAPVVVHRGWPLRRPLRPVFVRPPRVAVRVAPVRFLAPAVFIGVVVAAATAPAFTKETLVWEDSEALVREEEWTEFTLDCNARGRKLWLEVRGGGVRADWAEVVFDNGDTQVVDFGDAVRGPGLYPLLDFRDGRLVDHVRVVARAEAEKATVVLRLEK